MRRSSACVSPDPAENRPNPDRGADVSESGERTARSPVTTSSMATFSAVRTTGIYCRPGCGARPRAENIVTFELAAAAEAAGYRACLKCRPYRTAGTVTASAPELVCRAVQQIIAGALDEGSEPALGHSLGVSARHLRRLFNEHLGVTPSQLASSRRAHFARRLLDDSDLTITQVALASGFGSVRQFNRAMRDVFRAAPRDLRERRRRDDRLVADGGLTLRVPFEPPHDWDATLRFLAQGAIPGVESVHDGCYRRTIVLDGNPGLLELRAGGPDHLLLDAHLPYWEGLIHLVERTTRMVGIDTDITAGEALLASDDVLGSLVRRQAGIRIPGAWGPFEMGLHAVISQELDPVSTRATLAAIVRSHGTHVPGLQYGLKYAFPSAATLADTDLAACRLPVAVTALVKGFAYAVATNAVQLDSAASLDELVAALIAIAGVDASTAQMIALRLGHHDAFPHADPHLLSALRLIGEPTGSVDDAAERWRPCRALAAAHLVAHGMLLAPRGDIIHVT
ncbi:MAG: AlkA N-terminal domain-containing protein [Solirubrobacteraceae bacterium]